MNAASQLVSRCNSFLLQHQGLGDMLICSALTRHFLGTLPLPMGLFVDPRYLADAKHLYRDISESRLLLIPFTKRPTLGLDQFDDLFPIVESTGKPIVDLTMFRKNLPHYKQHGCCFDQCPYYYAGVPFRKKFEDFKCDPAPSIEIDPPAEPYVIYHDDPARHYWIDQNEIQTPDTIRRFPVTDFRPATIFATRKLFEEAEEVHCINSAFLNYVDFLKPTKPKLFWHYYSRRPENVSDPTLQCEWTILH